MDSVNYEVHFYEKEPKSSIAVRSRHASEEEAARHIQTQLERGNYSMAFLYVKELLSIHRTKKTVEVENVLS